MRRITPFAAVMAAAAIMLFLLVPGGATRAAGAEPVVPDGSDYTRLFADTLTHHLTLYISQSEWNGLSEDMLAYQDIDEWMRTGSYRHADIVYEDDIGTITLGNVGIRTRGNTTRMLPEDEDGLHRAHFALKFDETFDAQEGTEEYAALKDRSFCGLDKLNLKWNLWMDASHIHELYCYELLREAGVISPSVSLVSLDICIGGSLVHYGVYTMIEPVDKPFLTKRFGKQANDGNLYKCLWENIPASLEAGIPDEEIGIKDWESGYRPAYDLQTNEDAYNTWDLAAFIDNLNHMNDTDFAEYIARRFDVDSFLRLMAVNLLVGTPDDYRTTGNNYYLYFNNAGRIVMIPYDYDSSLGGGWDGGDAATYEGLATEDIYTAVNLNTAYTMEDVAHPLWERILAIPEYRQRYERYLADFIDTGLFSYERFEQKFWELETLYGNVTCSDTMDSGETMKLTTEAWFFETKTVSVLRQLGRG